jgi:hypothetical protein
MKKVTTLFKGVGLSFCALLVAGSLTLSGCSLDTLGGPDLGAQEESRNGGSIQKGDSHNEDGNSKNGGGSIQKGDSHNEDGNS